MSILSRFFGKQEAESDSNLILNDQIESPLSLQVLFSNSFAFNSSSFESKFRSYHPSLSEAKIELDEELKQQGSLIGLIGWGEHVIQIVGFDHAMPAEAVEQCIAPSHYRQDLKLQAKAHKSHIILYYKGYDDNPINQYASMALVAGFLSYFGAIVVTNESALTSFPTIALNRDNVDGDIVELIQSLPLLILFCGIVKYKVDGIDGVWLRTYGAQLLGLPDMASLARDHSISQSIFDIFSNVFGYLLNSGVKFSEGNTMQVGEDLFMKLRLPSREEYFLNGENELFVVEFITQSEINQC
ncbi:DUF4261 domain-containing protein [Neptuniibacter sp.]|uniref:DUF4261 domain-containing protein n=1 Tax=Neptuniibacter sp. TaxID=1962643 RepID=UPI0026033DFF|nr:DUF4261 domain-containing protein [Neptuniibacter sp.]MCP4597573.1 DUF4261 domain-containing protein [Neptuniibacter sp.]